MKSIIIGIVALASTMLCVCEGPQTPVKDLEKLVNKVEKNHKEYTDEDWKKVAEEYAVLKEEFYKHEYSNEELKEIGRLKGRLKGYFAKKEAKKLGKSLEEIANEIGGSIEGFLNVLTEQE